jgi:hypothetical protein
MLPKRVSTKGQNLKHYASQIWRLLNVLALQSQVKNTKWRNIFETNMRKYRPLGEARNFSLQDFLFYNRVFRVSSFTQQIITAV